MIFSAEKNFNYLIPSLFLFPFFKENISTFFFILLTINTIYYSIKSKSFSISKQTLLLTIPFWIILITCLLWYSKPEDLKPVKNGLYFLLFPIVFLNIPKSFFTKEKLTFYFEVLKYVVLLICISYFLAFFYFYDLEHLFQYKYNIPKFRDFIYYEIPFFKIHPTYFTTIIIFTTSYSILNLLNSKKWSEIFFITVGLITSIALLAKFNMVFLFLLILFIILFKTKIKRFYKIILVLLLISSSFFLIKNVPGVKNRFVEIVNSYNKPPVGMSYDSTNIRVAIINCSKQIVEVNFIKGVGFNNIKQTFLECYKTTYDSGFYKNNIYLTHNYFMYILISSGIFGLFVFLFYIYNIIKLTIKINSFLLYVMLFNVLCVSLLEDFFYRQFGLFYFSLIFFCFLNNKRELIFKKESSQTIH
ncbi:O-antigen ligase family protein [Flavobacterium gelidilacus]|jgi:hypothetical protein